MKTPLICKQQGSFPISLKSNMQVKQTHKRFCKSLGKYIQTICVFILMKAALKDI